MLISQGFASRKRDEVKGERGINVGNDYEQKHNSRRGAQQVWRVEEHNKIGCNEAFYGIPENQVNYYEGERELHRKK